MGAPADDPPTDFDVLSEAEVAAILGALSGRAPTGVRNRALVALLYASGMRLGEALGLVEADLDLTAGTARLGERTVRVFGSALQFLEAWRITRRRRGLPASGPFFCTLAGKRVQDAYVRTMFRRTAKRAGIGKRLHAFGLRRTFAVRAHQEGLELDELQAQLGHASPQATFGYLADASVLLARSAARSLPFELVTGPPPSAAAAAQVVEAPAEPPAAPAPPAPVEAVEEPRPALPTPEPEDGAAYLGGEVHVVRPITLEEL